MKRFIGALLVLLLGCVPGWATLGQYESSVSTDRAQMRSQEKVETLHAYTVHELTADNGARVREYVSPKGLVFGVSWQGQFMPNLKQLLGNYANTLQSASPAQRQVRRMRGLVVKTQDFIFVSSGHMRAWKGYAYVPSLLPANVTAEVVQ